MLVCIGCGGRNLPELDVCPFCHRRLGSQANDSRALRKRLASIVVATLLLVLLVGVVLLVLIRTP
jgi:hypothetical protein